MSGAEFAQVAPLRKPVNCPSCGARSSRKNYPFCCNRCQDVDLHKWFSGSYAVAANDGEDFDAET